MPASYDRPPAPPSSAAAAETTAGMGLCVVAAAPSTGRAGSYDIVDVSGGTKLLLLVLGASDVFGTAAAAATTTAPALA